MVELGGKQVCLPRRRRFANTSKRRGRTEVQRTVVRPLTPCGDPIYEAAVCETATSKARTGPERIESALAPGVKHLGTRAGHPDRLDTPKGVCPVCPGIPYPGPGHVPEMSCPVPCPDRNTRDRLPRRKGDVRRRDGGSGQPGREGPRCEYHC
jgi:hypothetical protein